MNPFFGQENRRAIEPEIKDFIRSKINSEPVYGLEDIVNIGDAVFNEERFAGFWATGDCREWLLRLDAKKPLSWKTSPIPETNLPRISFILGTGFGNGSPLPQPSGQWDIFVNDRFAVSVRVVKHSQLWKNGECSFAFSANRIETAQPFGSLTLSSIIQNESSAAFGPAFLTVPTSWVDPGTPAIIRLEAKSDVPSTRWMQLIPVANVLQHTNIYKIIDMMHDSPHPSFGKNRVFFGDIHTHSGEIADGTVDKGCGCGSRETSYKYARGAGGLDIYALTEHEWQIDPAKNDEYFALADKYNEDGRFVCLPAFEYTNKIDGHRNVYFKTSDGLVLNADKMGWYPHLNPDKTNTPDQLLAAMEKTGVPFFTVPHHSSSASHPLNLDFYNQKYDRLFEIYSSWGSSEYHGDFPRGVSDRYSSGNFRDALKRGQRYGIIASSDGHDDHPGNAQSPLIKHHHIFHFCGSGWVAVFAEELTRDAIYDALYARRCYGTTGVPIALDVRLNEAMMGSEIPALPSGKYPQLSVKCAGTNGIDHIRIIKNGKVVHTEFCHNEFLYDLEWEDEKYDRTAPVGYYVRIVQKDRESAWSSPIWLG